MITINAYIDLSSSGGTISTVTSTASGNNISYKLSDVLGNKNVKIGNPFIFGKSKLGSGAKYTKKLSYFMSRELSNSNGEFANPFIITLNGSNITQFIISFDTKNGGFPNNIIVDGKTIVDDDPVWEVVVDKANTHTIKIPNWNKPNSPFILTSIYANLDIRIDRSNLLSFTSDIFDRSAVEYPEYGIISNTANISFSDLDESVLDLITQKLLHSGIEIIARIYNDKAHHEERICRMYIQSLSYDNDNRQVNLSLKDRLEVWQNINVNAIYYTPTVSTPQTAKWFYNKLYSITVQNGYNNILSFNELDSDTQDILTNTIIEYPILDSSNLWDEWTKLCSACFLHIWQDDKGKIIVKYSGGN